MNRPAACAGILVCLIGLGCLGDAERTNPFDPYSDAFGPVGQVEGLILDYALRGVPAVRVRLLPVGSGSQMEFVDHTDEEGRFRFGQVPVGGYLLSVEKAGYVAVPDTVTVAYRQTAELVVVLERGSFSTASRADPAGGSGPDLRPGRRLAGPLRAGLSGAVL